VAVLELLAGHPEERFTLSEVARRCGLNKATAHALLNALSEHGVLLRHPGEKRYSLGPRLVAIGDAARRGYTAVDFAGPVLERLAAATDLWARAWQLSDDHISSAGAAGAAGSGDPHAVVRLPAAPPVGALFMAWSDEPTVEAWLARAATVDAVRPAFEALPAIRRDGFAVTLASPEWRALTEPPARPAAGAGGATAVATAAIDQRALLQAVSRQALLVSLIEDAAVYAVSDVGAPVFGATGRVDLVVSVSGLASRPCTGAQIRAVAAQVMDAAAELTTAVCGCRPAGVAAT
jgi:DNA-binding IclR family transcriptional regulator